MIFFIYLNLRVHRKLAEKTTSQQIIEGLFFNYMEKKDDDPKQNTKRNPN